MDCGQHISEVSSKATKKLGYLRRILAFAPIVLQQTYHIVTHTSPHRVTSSNIYQIKAQSLESSKLHDATVRTEGEIFYGPSTEGTPNTLV